MRKGWQEKQLGEFMEFKNGVNATKEAYGHGVKFVNLMDIFKKPFLEKDDISGSVDISPKQASEYSVQEGDILFNRTSETPEEIACSSVYVGKEKITFGGFVIRGRQTKNLLIPFFAGYCFQSDQVRKSLISKCQGVVRGNIGQKELSKVSILIPPIAEQEKISAILRTWDDAIEKQQSLLVSIKKKRALIIQKAFSPQNAPLKQLSEIANIIVSNVDKKSLPDQRQVSLCNYMDVFYNRYITTDISFMVATASDREIQTYSLQKGDAVFTKDSETPEEIAMCASIEEDIPNLVCGYHLAIARPNQKKVLGTYLAEAINAPRIHHRFVRCANGATRFGLTRSDIDEIEIPVPSLDQQTKIISAVYECDSIIKLIQKQIIILQNQKRGLMQKLLTGAWPVQVSDKEAA